MSWSSRAAGALVTTSLTFTAGVTAQGMDPRFGVAVGLTVPTGDYHATASGEGFSSGWMVMALVALKVTGWPVGVRVDGAYGANGANDQLKADLTAALGKPTDESTKLLGANIDVIYPPPSTARAQPYLLGGVGVYHVTISTTSGSATTSNSETKLAWNVGGGMIYRLRGVAFVFEARYVNVAAISRFPRTTFLPIAAGIRFGGQ